MMVVSLDKGIKTFLIKKKNTLKLSLLVLLQLHNTNDKEAGLLES